MEGILACGYCESSPPSLILRYLSGPRLFDALADLAALLSTCRSWADYGDGAWSILRNCCETALPSPLRFFLASIPLRSDLLAGPLGSGRATFKEFWLQQRKFLARNKSYHGGSPHSFFPGKSAKIVLFGEEIEFFAALRNLNEPIEGQQDGSAAPVIRVVVGPSFAGVDLSSPALVGRFLILSHEAKGFAPEGTDGGLLAIHPSALAEEEEIAATVLADLPGTGVAIGIDPALGRMLAGMPSAPGGAPAPEWRSHIIECGRRHVDKHGPYFVFPSFCDAMYPSSFCAPATGGFYNISLDREGTLNWMVGNAMLQLQDRLIAPPTVSFVGIYITGCLSIDIFVCPL